jgi:eukaryotic-like serine/threonine-protein kinase
MLDKNGCIAASGLLVWRLVRVLCAFSWSRAPSRTTRRPRAPRVLLDKCITATIASVHVHVSRYSPAHLVQAQHAADSALRAGFKSSTGDQPFLNIFSPPLMANRFYEFGPFRIDTANHVLLRDGQTVPLKPKAFDTLLVLVENRGRVLDKDELMNRLWPDTAVEESNLSQNIYLLRKVLGEEPEGESYIQTMPRRGYRFVARVTELDVEPADLILEEHTRSQIIIEDERDREMRGRTAGGATRAQTAVTGGIASATSGALGALKRHKLISALAAIVIAAAVGVLLFYPHHTPALTERDTILIADVTNRTGEDVFDGTLTQALAVQLEQSPFLNIFPDERVRDTLQFMRRPADERVTKEIAREICERQGIKAMLAGSISSLGANYILTLEAVNSHTGDVLAREQVEARGKEEVLGRLGNAASKMREKLGESLRSIERRDAPIEQVTTCSLEALRAFSLGHERARSGKYGDAIPFFRRATEIDPAFALAYVLLSISYRQTGQVELAAEAVQNAHRLRERTSERERLEILANYYIQVTGETDKAIETCEVRMELYPDDSRARNILGTSLYVVGRDEEAVREFRERTQLLPYLAVANVNLSRALIRLGQFEQAKEVLAEARVRNPNNESFRQQLFLLAFAQGDATAIEEQIRWASGKPDAYGLLQAQATVLYSSGQMRNAREVSRRAIDLRRQCKGERSVRPILHAVEGRRQECPRSQRGQARVRETEVDTQFIGQSTSAGVQCLSNQPANRSREHRTPLGCATRTNGFYKHSTPIGVDNHEVVVTQSPRLLYSATLGNSSDDPRNPNGVAAMLDSMNGSASIQSVDA